MRKGDTAMNKSKHISVTAMFLLALMLLPVNESFAQRRGGMERNVRRERPRSAVIVNLPREHQKVVVGGREYFYGGGVFYRSGPRGYAAIAAPIGARIKVLPAGYTTVTLAAGPLFLYYGTYYRFDPVERDYVVVNPDEKPDVPPPQTLDHIALVDGTALDGTFISGTKSTIQFDVNGEIREIPIEQIISITFAPPAK
jgi:hypothetical protein